MRQIQSNTKIKKTDTDSNPVSENQQAGKTAELKSNEEFDKKKLNKQNPKLLYISNSYNYHALNNIFSILEILCNCIDLKS